MSSPEHSPLSHSTPISVTQYDPSLLYPILRAQQRDTLPTLPDHWHGVDHWHCYEMSWLNAKGKPQVGTMEIQIPATSPSIIESKSLKLYFNSLNQTRFDNTETLLTTLSKDLSGACGVIVLLNLTESSAFQNAATHQWPAANLDELDIEISGFKYDPSLLQLADDKIITEQLSSHLLKSNCLVTGQPDWGSIIIDYTGPTIDRESLLRYLISFRTHNEFHEHCVERIFTDLRTHCHCEKLSIYAAYTRRGGLDICPFRSTDQYATLPDYRHARQ